LAERKDLGWLLHAIQCGQSIEFWI